MKLPTPSAGTLRLVGGLTLAALVAAAVVAELWPRTKANAPATVENNGDDDGAWLAALERLERRAAAGVERARESVLALEYRAAGSPANARRVATGVVIDALGSVLSIRIEPPARPRGTTEETDAEESARIVARDVQGRRHLVEWVAADPDTGLTLLRIPTGAPRPIEPAAAPPTLGSRVFVVGNPFGLGQSVSRGQISGLDRSLELRSQPLHGLIQVQAPLFPGDGGAVVADFRGRWLGLIRGGLDSPAENESRTETENAEAQRSNDLGFAIPAERALWIASRLLAQGKVDRAYLGVRLEPDANGDGAPESAGARLRDVLPDTPAARAGLHPGDRITAFDGQPIRSSLDLTERLDRSAAGERVRLEIVRAEGHDASLWIDTTSRPAPLLPASPPPISATITDSPRPIAAATATAVEVVPTAATLPPPEPPTLLDRLNQLEQRVERLEHARP